MAKTINYKYLAFEINHGTEENPNIEQIIADNFFICPTQESYNKMYPIAEKEAIHDTIEVTGEFDPEPIPEPTQLDRIESQVTYTAIMTDTLIY